MEGVEGTGDGDGGRVEVGISLITLVPMIIVGVRPDDKVECTGEQAGSGFCSRKKKLR